MLTRASGMDLASSLRQNTFLIEKKSIFDPEHPIPEIFFGTLIFTGPVKMLGICAWLNLDILGVPAGLVHSIGILEARRVFLAHPWLKCERRLALKSWMLYPA